MLAEDNLVNQELLFEILTVAGFQVDLATDGQQAVELAALQRYDLILMDLQMPALDGLQATQQIRRMDQHAATPILAVTANALSELPGACMGAGLNGHIAKPLDVAELFKALNHWLPDSGASETSPVRSPVLGAAARSAFDGIAGLQVQGTLLFVPGREDILWRVLRQFCSSYEKGLPALDAHLVQQQAKAAVPLVHSLRGAAGAVGANELQLQCERLERALIALPDGDARVSALKSQGAALQQSLLALAAAIRARLDAQQV